MDRGINPLFHQYFSGWSPHQLAQLGELAELYAHWNSQINVISRKDMDSFDERHVLHSLAIQAWGLIPRGAWVLDVGTGGGFPGIPLAIANPHAQFTLIDGRGKKIQVVREVVQALGLKNVRAEAIRSESLDGTFDIITARAVTQLPALVRQIQHLSRPGTQLLALKGGDLSEELSAFPRAEVRNLSDVFDGAFFETKKLLIVPLR